MELCLMASIGYLPGPALVFHPSENGRLLKTTIIHALNCTISFQSRRLCYLPKSNHPGLEHQIVLDQDPSRLCSFNPSPDQAKESLKSLIGRLDDNKLLRSHLELRRPGHVELQEFASYPIRFGSGIAEQCTKHDKTSRFIFPGSDEEESHKMTLFEVLKFVGPQVRRMTMPQQSWAPYCEECVHGTDPRSLLLTPNSELCSTESLFVGDLNHCYHTHLPDGQLSFTDYEMEIKDVLLSLSEDFSPNKSIHMTTRAILVPYFDRRIRKGVKANYAESSSILQPAKSGEKVKNGTSSSRKKTNTKVVKEKEFYKNNNLHACESLLSLMFEKTRHDRTAILSLKRSGTGITNLLSQFSASIAGTGLALILSVACKVACGGLPFCTSKFLSTGLGLGLVWLSWAVNQLRDTVITINKSSGKFGIGEEELMLSLDQRVKDIYFRAATLLAVVILRFA